jgi:hypothetical protein
MNSIEEQSELKVGIYFIVKTIIFTDKEFLKEQKFSYVFRTAISDCDLIQQKTDKADPESILLETTYLCFLFFLNLFVKYIIYAQIEEKFDKIICYME